MLISKGYFPRCDSMLMADTTPTSDGGEARSNTIFPCFWNTLSSTSSLGSSMKSVSAIVLYHDTVCE